MGLLEVLQLGEVGTVEDEDRPAGDGQAARLLLGQPVLQLPADDQHVTSPPSPAL